MYTSKKWNKILQPKTEILQWQAERWQKVQEGCVQLEIACDSIPWGLKFEFPSENRNKLNKSEDSTKFVWGCLCF